MEPIFSDHTADGNQKFGEQKKLQIMTSTGEFTGFLVAINSMFQKNRMAM